MFSIGRENGISTIIDDATQVRKLPKKDKDSLHFFNFGKVSAATYRIIQLHPSVFCAGS